MLHRSRALALIACLALAPACSGAVSKDDIRSAEGTITGLTVAGEVGSAPAVRMATPLKVAATRSEVVLAGTGAPVQIDQLFVLQLTLYDARTGLRAASTYDDGKPLVVKSSDDRLFPELARALVGQRQGSRVVLALASTDAYGVGGTPPPGVRATDAVVAVADVVAVPPVTVATVATGKPHPPVSGAPSVRFAGAQPVSLDFTGAIEPTKLTVVPLIDGAGPVVRNHSLVTLDYLTQRWGRKVPVESTYFKEPRVVPIGTEGSVPAWDLALIGVHQGSRVLVIAPAGPNPGYVGENETTAWIFDVLGVS